MDLVDTEVVLREQRTPHQPRMFMTDNFVPAHCSQPFSFWQDVILPESPDAKRDTLLGCLQGVGAYDFVDPNAIGEFLSRQYNGVELTSVHLHNPVPH